MSVAAAPATESAAPILRLRGVGRRFGGLHAVSAVDLDVRPGERRAILGPNGAGKTTLFNVIAGEFPPTAGTIELFGRDVTYLPARAAGRNGPDPHLPDLATLPRPHRSRTTSTCRSSASREGICGRSSCAARDGRLRGEAREIGRARRARGRHRRAREEPLARRAAPARGGHGAGRRAAADDARRARRRAFPDRAA